MAKQHQMIMRATGLLSLMQLQLLLAAVRTHQYLSLATEFSNSREKSQAATAPKERGGLRLKYHQELHHQTLQHYSQVHIKHK